MIKQGTVHTLILQQLNRMPSSTSPPITPCYPAAVELVCPPIPHHSRQKKKILINDDGYISVPISTTSTAQLKVDSAEIPLLPFPFEFQDQPVNTSTLVDVIDVDIQQTSAVTYHSLDLKETKQNKHPLVEWNKSLSHINRRRKVYAARCA